MWLGDVPIELQGLTIPEEKLISLHRQNSCVIKLQSPFHTSTTAQGALKGNCITFLQNTPNIVNSLPLTMEDLCDTLKVIFIGARPSQRIQLKRVLTVRKKKVAQALYWLKNNNIFYKNIEINMDNIMKLPEDDVPESIMLTMEQKIGDEQEPSARAGYIPDPLLNPVESVNSDSIPINNSAVLDVNGSLVSSDEINNYILTKIKNDGTDNQMDVERVYLIPHSSKPANEYFNPKLLAGLYPALFCYGRGTPEDQSKSINISLREHIRYLLSYDDRRFEKNHSFIFLVFNILQRRDACLHAQLIATKPYFRSSAQEIQSLKSSDIETALKNISTKTYDMSSNKALDILTISPSGMTKSSITLDPNDNNTYIMFIQWTPRPHQYGIHQLCLTPVDSIGQTGQQVCYTFQVDIAPPQFVDRSMTPRGLVSRNQAIWSISTDQNIVPSIQAIAYIRYFKRIIGGTDQEVLRISTANNVIYQSRRILINTGSMTWEEDAHYYILFDSGVVSINQSCGIESSPITDKYFWEFWTESARITTQEPVTTNVITTSTTKSISTTTTRIAQPITTTINNNVSNKFCPKWLTFNTILNLTSSIVQPNHAFCFTVNTTFADVTIVANTWVSCSTWKISGTADPLLELFTPETNIGSPIAQNDDGNSISHLNCYAAVLSYRLMKGNHRIVIRHQKCAYGNFELRISSETNNILK
ncbi:unnamed protein product [Adineta ricciae]|uniref:DUF6570 domain-containing protein n=1 Tax=Adineta ricciae TaxID=249248 RepID=A0A815NP01_ADIRI|nr:unnamed protein product [Adineta ricciae]CAF1440845.1 unnamed protein product [Adineta ricciae]